MDLRRRQFLKTTFAGLGAAPVAAFAAETPVQAKAPKNEFSTDPTAWVNLTSAIKAPRIGLGTGVHGGGRECNLTRMDHEKALDILRYAYDSGVKFFDLADMYGSHALTKEALKGKPRDSYVLSTKIWGHPGGVPEKERPGARACVERFLKELGVEYIDLVQIHCMTAPNWEEQFGKYFDEMEALKKEGLIRGHGVSCHSLGAVQTAAANPWVDAIHMRMNTAETYMDGSLKDNVAAAQKAQDAGKGIICMKVLAEGSIKDPEGRKRSTDFAVRCPEIDVMVVGFEERSHIDEFLANASETLKTMEAEQKAATK
ncbi:MAG: aldo/keto reductase [Thermoguttaceae bacterium]|nr:aldo/keto reductase [Thermoguttaceae bacterium]